MNTKTDWRLKGHEPASPAQLRLLNAACDCLGEQVDWGGYTIGKEGWRHLISGTVLGFIIVPTIDMGDGRKGVVMLGQSSLKLSMSQCTDAITMAFWIGDRPDEQGLNIKPVIWSDVIYLARRIPDSER